MSRTLTVFALLPGLLLASFPVSATDATGFVRAEGCAYFSGYAVHLQRADGKKLDTPIAFRIPQSYFWDNMVKDWSNVAAEECSTSNPCATVTAGKIRIRRVLRVFSILRLKRTVRGLAGDFAIELKDGKKVDGSFQIKLKNPTQKIICE